MAPPGIWPAGGHRHLQPIADAPPRRRAALHHRPRGLADERLQRQVPAARFVKAFSSVGNAHMVNPTSRREATMFICGDDAAPRPK